MLSERTGVWSRYREKRPRAGEGDFDIGMNVSRLKAMYYCVEPRSMGQCQPILVVLRCWRCDVGDAAMLMMQRCWRCWRCWLLFLPHSSFWVVLVAPGHFPPS